MLYLEIDYLNEASNSERFAADFEGIEYVRVPKVYREVSTPRVLTMEFVESFKLTNIKRVESLGLDKELLAKRTADTFLRQIVETGFFHCDPHPGNLCVDTSGNLVYYDFGMMDELKVRKSFKQKQKNKCLCPTIPSRMIVLLLYTPLLTRFAPSFYYYTRLFARLAKRSFRIPHLLQRSLCRWSRHQGRRPRKERQEPRGRSQGGRRFG